MTTTINKIVRAAATATLLAMLTCTIQGTARTALAAQSHNFPGQMRTCSAQSVSADDGHGSVVYLYFDTCNLEVLGYTSTGYSNTLVTVNDGRDGTSVAGGTGSQNVNTNGVQAQCNVPYYAQMSTVHSNGVAGVATTVRVTVRTC